MAKATRGIGVVTTDLEAWQLEWDEFGPLALHRHPVGSILAYVFKDAAGARWASCPSCSQRIRLGELNPSIKPDED